MTNPASPPEQPMCKTCGAWLNGDWCENGHYVMAAPEQQGTVEPENIGVVAHGSLVPEENATARLAIAAANCIGLLVESTTVDESYQKSARQVATELRALATSQPPAPTLSEVIQYRRELERIVELRKSSAPIPETDSGEATVKPKWSYCYCGKCDNCRGFGAAPLPEGEPIEKLLDELDISSQRMGSEWPISTEAIKERDAAKAALLTLYQRQQEELEQVRIFVNSHPGEDDEEYNAYSHILELQATISRQSEEIERLREQQLTKEDAQVCFDALDNAPSGNAWPAISTKLRHLSTQGNQE